MDKRILSNQQQEIVPLLKAFNRDFGLVGGTAIALQLGHRRSIDFDLFTNEVLHHEDIRKVIRSAFPIQSTIVENPDELTLVAHGIKLTFLSYPFPLAFAKQLDDIIGMPDSITLAAMKSFALGKRAKWKDYVDLFFMFKTLSLSDITSRSKTMFKGEFNEKLFREQLSYFEDIDYSETIDYMPGFETADETIRQSLQQIAIQK